MARTYEKRYLVAVPIPYLDKSGRRLGSLDKERWTERALKELTECFGGATTIPAPGTNMLGTEILFEKGQVLAVAACENREEFLMRRDRVQAFVQRMGTALRQHSVFVLSFPSDSFLVELESED